MNFKFAHNNINVLNLDESLAFYKEALGLTEVSRKIAEDGSFILVYLGDTSTKHQLELTWLRVAMILMTSATMKSTLHSLLLILRLLMKSTKQWAASVMKTKQWEFTSLPTQTATGWKLFQKKIRLLFSP